MLSNIQIILAISFSLLALLCITTNGLTCFVIITRKTTVGPLRYYLFSLAIADILIGAISIPFYEAMAVWQVQAPAILGRLLSSTDMFLGVCSILHISLMAFDRLMAVKNPIFHRVHMKKRSTVLKLFAIPWLLSLLLAIIIAEVFQPKHQRIMAPITGIALPFTFVIICYVLIYAAIRQRNEQFSNSTNTSNTVNEKKLRLMIICVLFAFLVCWIPFCITNANIDYILKSLNLSQVLDVVYSVKFLQYFNSTCNPFVYAIFNPAYRSAVKDVLKKCFGKKDNAIHDTFTSPDTVASTAL